jgi:hypothetical protein
MRRGWLATPKALQLRPVAEIRQVSHPFRDGLFGVFPTEVGHAAVVRV